MPALVGRTLDEARQVLAGQAIRNNQEIRSAEHSEPQGVIYGQSPRAGTPLGAATPIVLEVSSGPRPILMPALIGRTVDEARRALEERRIANTPVIRRAEHAEPRGEIYGQSPEAGASLGAGDSIVLDVSDGPPSGPSIMVEVPRLAGLEEAEAIALLREFGLNGVQAGPEELSVFAAGRVVRSTPGEGERVPQGSAVRYALSLGPAPESGNPALRWLRDNPAVSAALVILALILAAVVVKILMPPRPAFTVHLAGPPLGKVDWGSPPDLEFKISVDPPRARMRRLPHDPDEEGA